VASSRERFGLLNSSIYPRIITSRLRGLIASIELVGSSSCRAGLRAFLHFIYIHTYIRVYIYTYIYIYIYTHAYIYTRESDKRSVSFSSFMQHCRLPPSALSWLRSRLFLQNFTFCLINTLPGSPSFLLFRWPSTILRPYSKRRINRFVMSWDAQSPRRAFADIINADCGFHNIKAISLCIFAEKAQISVKRRCKAVSIYYKTIQHNIYLKRLLNNFFLI